MNLVDNFASTLNGAYTSGGTSMVLNSVTGLPSGACDFYYKVPAEGANTTEIFHCTNVNAGTKTLTVAGAQANTAPSNHSNGATAIAGVVVVNVLNQLSPPQSQNVVTGSRVIGTVYHNTGLNPMLVLVCVNKMSGTQIQAFTDASNPPTTQVVGQNTDGFGAADAVMITFMVMPGNFYEVTSTGAMGVYIWTEYQ